MNLANLKKRGGIESVLGIDASTKSLAFCLTGPNGPVRWGQIYFEGSNVFERLADGQRKISALQDVLHADMIVIESAVYVQNKKTVIQLAYAFGAILGAVVKKGVVVNELTPTEWQFAIGNKTLSKEEKAKIQREFPDKSKTWYSAKYREVRKERTIRWAEDTHGILVESDDVSDAIAIAHVGFEKFVRSEDAK